MGSFGKCDTLRRAGNAVREDFWSRDEGEAGDQRSDSLEGINHPDTTQDDRRSDGRAYRRKPVSSILPGIGFVHVGAHQRKQLAVSDTPTIKQRRLASDQ